MSKFETPKLPEVKFNKNGYEIRTDILGMAKDHVQNEFNVKFQGWEMTAKRDEKTNQIVSTVEMPSFPGLDKVLETAGKMYEFVNQGVAPQAAKK
jgi:protein-disulfide isomerase-like protein with CxxC motif